jgi:hypothetical protein
MEVDGCIETSALEMYTSTRDVVCWVIWNMPKTQLTTLTTGMKFEWYVGVFVETYEHDLGTSSGYNGIHGR